LSDWSLHTSNSVLDVKKEMTRKNGYSKKRKKNGRKRTEGKQKEVRSSAGKFGMHTVVILMSYYRYYNTDKLLVL
jgi:hypothetical protein